MELSSRASFRRLDSSAAKVSLSGTGILGATLRVLSSYPPRVVFVSSSCRDSSRTIRGFKKRVQGKTCSANERGPAESSFVLSLVPCWEGVFQEFSWFAHYLHCRSVTHLSNPTSWVLSLLWSSSCVFSCAFSGVFSCVLAVFRSCRASRVLIEIVASENLLRSRFAGRKVNFERERLSSRMCDRAV